MYDEDSYSVYNFREGRMIFHPHVFGVKFLLDENVQPEKLTVGFFFSGSSLERLLWFNSYLKNRKQRASIIFGEMNASIIFGKLVMSIEEFPVKDYALAFGAERVLEKKIAAMDAMVEGDFGLQVYDRDGLLSFVGRECLVNFQPKADEPPLFVEKQEMLEAPGEVSAAFALN